jgi:hypothetical protein
VTSQEGFENLTAQATCAALRARRASCSNRPIRVSNGVTIAGRFGFRASASPGFPQTKADAACCRSNAKCCGVSASAARSPRRASCSKSGQGFDVRATVPGRTDPWDLFARISTDAALARRIGRAIGTLLVEQHTKIVCADVDWLPE